MHGHLTVRVPSCVTSRFTSRRPDPGPARVALAPEGLLLCPAYVRDGCDDAVDQTDVDQTDSHEGEATVQLQRGVPVAGVEPQLARDLARAVHSDYRETEEVAWRVKMSEPEVEPLLDALAAAGYLIKVTSPADAPADDPVPDHGGWPKWRTTLAGGALTMASFLKPISRAKAETLMQGVLDRAAAYNADPGKPFVITEVRAFGSYITDAAQLGDLDLAITYADRDPALDRAKVHLAYARASGRTFSTFLDELHWAYREMLQILRNRSGYINVHTEDISRFTDQWEVVYSYPTSPA